MRKAYWALRVAVKSSRMISTFPGVTPVCESIYMASTSHTWPQDHDLSSRHKRGCHLGDDLIICFQFLQKKKTHKNQLFQGHKVILGIGDNPWWVKDQCGRNTCSSVIKHDGAPDTFSHSVLAVTLQCCYVPWLMILHYRSFQYLVE